MATQSKLVCLKSVFVHFSSVISPWLGNPSVFYTFYLVYIWHCRIKLFLRHLPNCPCSYFSPYVDLFQEISPRIAKRVSIFRWSLCHFYEMLEIIRLLLCFFSDLYFPPTNSGKNIRSASIQRISLGEIQSEK
jgi:hypothetical protein